METAKIVEPISGEMVYQKKAREALPLLVRQAEAGETIYYSDLALELGMPNPRNLNYVLGSIGSTLENLSKAWKEEVPPIQCVVIAKSSGIPGEGIGWFLEKTKDYKSLSLKQQEEIYKASSRKVFFYPRWNEVLNALQLTPAKADFSSLVKAASGGWGGGESQEHKMLKEYVAKNPAAIGLKTSTTTGDTEYPLPSGDFVDVSFKGKKLWVFAEVKSALSDQKDIVRGLFQCIKYKAVGEAVLIAEKQQPNVRALLVLESAFPPTLIPLRNMLGVEVVDRVSPRS